MSGKQGSQHRSSNEGKACDAAVRVLEQRTGATRADIRRPEKDRVGPPADLRLQLGTQEYAIEHTQIEAFKRQIATGVSLMQLIDPVKQALCGELQCRTPETEGIIGYRRTRPRGPHAR